jgi:4-amino-4-deoxy-L-arabinose transferase-like glycosyltransferase
MDPIMAGRVISVLAGLLCLHYLFSIARKVYGNDAAKFTAMLFIVFPLGVWVQTRVLTESLFLFASTATIYSFLKSWNNENRFDFLTLMTFSALCALTRPEGTLFGILVVIAGIRLFRQRRFSDLLYSIPGLAFWLVFISWIVEHSKRTVTYGTVAADSITTFSSERSLSYLASYLGVYPYIFGYVAFGLGFLNLISPRKRNRNWTAIILAVNAVWLLMLSVHWAWSTRFLLLPATLLLVESGEKIAEIRNNLRPAYFRILTTVTFTSLIALASVSLYWQRDLFADCKEAALFIRSKRTNQRVFSDESIKTGYYLNAPVLNYSRTASYQPGDIITLHSFHTDLRSEMVELSRLHKLAFVYIAKAYTIPILANLPLERFSDTSSPLVLTERFRKQEFQSVVIQVLK